MGSMGLCLCMGRRGLGRRIVWLAMGLTRQKFKSLQEEQSLHGLLAKACGRSLLPQSRLQRAGRRHPCCLCRPRGSKWAVGRWTDPWLSRTIKAFCCSVSRTCSERLLIREVVFSLLIVVTLKCTMSKSSTCWTTWTSRPHSPSTKMPPKIASKSNPSTPSLWVLMKTVWLSSLMASETATMPLHEWTIRARGLILSSRLRSPTGSALHWASRVWWILSIWREART